MFFNFVLRINIKKNIYYILVLFGILVLLPFLVVSPFKPQNITNDLRPYYSQKTIRVYNHITKEIVVLDIEEYIKGVIVAEMPIEFEEEALKAQAVAARTFAFGRLTKNFTSQLNTHLDADVCTDPGHCQAWTTKEKISQKWKEEIKTSNWAKIEQAVSETKNIVITYNGVIINPLYHSNSGGFTENIEEVWGGSSVPYLKSVISEGENVTSEYESCYEISTTDFIEKFKQKYPEIKFAKSKILDNVNILSNTTGNRVKDIKVGNITLKGTDIRAILSLKSAAFKFEISKDNKIKITTKGYGHGVGMSQWGANAMAKKGSYYQQVLLYYYKDVDFSTIDHFKM